MLTSPPPALKRRLATVIRERRVRLGLSQEAFADQLEMHRAFYGRMENGQNMTLQTLERIADGLGIKPSLLLREAESLVDVAANRHIKKV